MSTYVYIDVSRKQEYIYRHNKLSENLLHSCVIKVMTEDTKAIIESEKDKELSEMMSRFPVTLTTYLENYYSEKYEFQFSGGGNSIILFSNKSEAHSFVRGFSAKVLEFYPELELYISVYNSGETKAEPNQDGMKTVRSQLIQLSDKLKDSRRSQFRRWTYGIEKVDEAGKAKAVPTKNPSGQNIQIARRLLASRLERQFEGYPVKITLELQDYKKQDDGKSYIGIVAIDGNKMGEMVSKLESFGQLRIFSHEIETIYLEAVAQTLRDFGQRKCQGKDEADGRSHLLVTPVVLAGDDICLIVEAEYAIQIAARIVENIQLISEQAVHQQILLDLIGSKVSLKACAGVTIVKVTYPFYEAVKAAESLCHKAKEALWQKGEHAADASFIQWKIVEGQVMSETAYDEDIRHGRDEETYHIMPLRVDQEKAYDQHVFSYQSFERMVSRIHKLPDRSSFLEQMKNVMYGGWVSYKLLFETNQMEIGEKIHHIVTEELTDQENGSLIAANAGLEHAAIVTTQGNSKRYTYILNDILEAMDFMWTEGEADDDTD
ncbi:hypothetical protein ACFOQM_01145 [Paenibacillus sp. GCM10012307]|uniref:Cas10/Cmr2 second palm domain-containing protein n=1 Tax=Paenibacillus roseus TaxID=2798579 RepID=A0A934J1N0_9BACL|nr:hypothetical protein [Paenibacillus roseus]MBJ6359929.1 hypothetical protein [Paenibacillus roseus]